MTPANQTFADGVGAVTAAALNSMVQWCDTAADLRGFVGLADMTVLLLGIGSVADGGQGTFYWNSTSIAVDDNTNVIRPNGVILGAWIRLITTSSIIGNLYVSPTGSDSNNGLALATPFLTLQKAAAVASTLSLGGQNLVINMANGAYSAGAVFSGPSNGAANATNGGGGAIIISGTSPGGAVIADTSANVAAIIALFGVQVSLQNVTISAVSGAAVFPSYGAAVNIGPGVVIGTCHFGQFHAETAGAVRINNSYMITGGAPAHLQAVLGGFIIYNETNVTVTLTGTPVFSKAFADCEDNSIIYCNTSFVTFSGAATGIRYYIASNGVVETESGLATFLPGNSAGQTQTGGHYLPPAPVSVNAFTGLGGAGNVVVGSQAGIRGGAAELVAASGAGSSGSVTLMFSGDVGPGSISVVASLSVGTGGWAAGATVTFGGLTTSLMVLKWDNVGTNLTAGLTYFITWIGNSLPP